MNNINGLCQWRSGLTACHNAAIGRHHGAGDPRDFRRCEKQDRLSNVRRPPIVAKRMERIERRQGGTAPAHPSCGWRFDDRRRNGFNPDIGSGEFDREIARQHMHAGICGGVRSRRRRSDRSQCRQRPSLHDRTATLLQHAFGCHLCREELEDRVEEPIVLTFGDLEERLWTEDLREVDSRPSFDV